MGLVKYKNIETGELLSSPTLFIKQIGNAYQPFEQELISLIIEVIRECIIDEKVGGSDLYDALEKMSKLKTNMYPVPEGLNQISRSYKDLLVLFRNQNIEGFLKSCNFPEGYAAGREEEVSQMAKDIFDNIRDATERSLGGEATKDELRSALKSRDPEQKKRALEQVNRSWTERINNDSFVCKGEQRVKI